MNKEITETESKQIDLILELLLSYKYELFLVPSKTFFAFKKFGIINEKRIEFICERLNILKVFELKNENRRAEIHFFKDRITVLLANGGMTDIWLEREVKRVNIKLINKTLKDYFLTKCISWLSFAIAGILAVLEIIKYKNR
jgi:hypothetical protein